MANIGVELSQEATCVPSIVLMCAVCSGLWDGMKREIFVKFYVYTLVLMKSHVFWDVAAC